MSQSPEKREEVEKRKLTELQMKLYADIYLAT
jgi:SNF2 family DNA or RNA helicase